MNRPDIPWTIVQCDEAALSFPDSVGPDPAIHRFRSHGEGAELDLQMLGLHRIVLDQVRQRHADLFRIAAYIYRADLAVSRGGDQDTDARNWKRRFHLCVPVTDPDFWNQPDVVGALTSALRFLTDDQWSFAFTQAKERWTSVQRPFAPPFSDRQPGAVVLFSGGLDSLSALIEAALRNEQPVAIGHWASTRIQARQETLLRGWHERYSALRIPLLGVPIIRRGQKPIEDTQRTRGFLYGCVASAIAAEIGAARVYLADNGPISLNLPINDQLVGAMASRATHPQFFWRLNRLIGQVALSPVTISNPLQWKTRAETLDVLKETGVEHLVRQTVSCSTGPRLAAATPHCGGCSQCVDRRVATIAAGLEAHDPQDGYQQDIFLDELHPPERAMTAYSYVRFARSWTTLDEDEVLERYPQLVDILTPDDPAPEQTLQDAIDLMRRHTNTIFKVMETRMEQNLGLLLRGKIKAGSLIGKIAGEQDGRRAAQATVRVNLAASDDQYETREITHSLAPEQPKLEWTGGAWLVEFGGVSRTLPASINMNRLAVLLREPGRRFSPEQIKAIVNDSPVETNADEREGLSVGVTRQDLADAQTRKTVRAEIKTLTTELHDLRALGDDELAEETERQIAMLDEYLNGAFGLGGRARSFTDPSQKVYKSTRKSLVRAIAIVGNHHRSLARHLEQSIHLSAPFVYQPEPPIRWSIVLPSQAA